MTKITQNYFQAKSKSAIKGLSLFALLLIGTQMSWGQQPIGTGQFDGGFENATLKATNVSSNTPDASLWTFDSAILVNSKIQPNGSNTRSGLNSFKLETNAPMSGKYVMSPVLNPAIIGGDGTIAGPTYTVQFYTKNLTGIAGLDFRAALYTDARYSSAVTSQGAVDSNGWQKVTLNCPGKIPAGNPAKMYVGFGGTSIAPATTFIGYVDDLVVYQGALDIIAPASASNPVINGLNVSWTASADVDGGGYVVVRYATNPNADNDPNQNGIYAVNNIITNGTGSLSGTVVYVGTTPSFTDAVAGSVSGSDYYKIYTVDKAFNFSDEIVASALLKVDSVIFNENNVTIYKNNDAFYVNSGEGVINNIKVFDIQGKLIAEQKNVNSNSATIKNINKTNQALIVKVTSEDNKVVTKKIVN